MKHFKIPFSTILVLLLQSSAFSQPGDSLDPGKSSEPWKAYYRDRAANDYDLVWSGDELPLQLRPGAIVNWTNPLEKGQINGSTFVWEYQGRPIVVGQLFSYLTGEGNRSYCHVFSCLTDEKVVGRRDGQVFWNPVLGEQTGWHVAKSAGSPAGNRAGRLLQMRRLARQFTAYTDEASRGRRNLRLLPQPLYRSDETKKGRDSGLFAYVVGTDPELMVLIECDLKADSPVWRYRFVQSTRSTTVAKLKDQEVYRYESAGKDPQSLSAVYLSRHGVEIIPAEFDQ